MFVKHSTQVILQYFHNYLYGAKYLWIYFPTTFLKQIDALIRFRQNFVLVLLCSLYDSCNGSVLISGCPKLILCLASSARAGSWNFFLNKTKFFKVMFNRINFELPPITCKCLIKLHVNWTYLVHPLWRPTLFFHFHSRSFPFSCSYLPFL